MAHRSGSLITPEKRTANILWALRISVILCLLRLLSTSWQWAFEAAIPPPLLRSNLCSGGYAGPGCARFCATANFRGAAGISAPCATVRTCALQIDDERGVAGSYACKSQHAGMQQMAYRTVAIGQCKAVLSVRLTPPWKARQVRITAVGKHNECLQPDLKPT